MTSIINEMHDLGKMGKTVIIATHNSNIAVYTKPLNLIYREVNNNEYTTFIGNYYDKNLLRIHLDDDGLTEIEIKDKSEVLLNILEGGKDNFIERGNYYGTN